MISAATAAVCRTCVAVISGAAGEFSGVSLVTVVIVSGTLPVFGEMLHDPIATVSRIDNSVAVLLGALPLSRPAIGINIVANFVSWRLISPTLRRAKSAGCAGGRPIAAVASTFITP